MTLLLTARDVDSLLDPAELQAALRRAFARRPADDPGRRVPLALPAGAPDGAAAMVLGPGWTPGLPAYTVKIHAKFPEASPALKGLLILHDLETGAALAVMESARLTAIRTAAVGGLAADLLAVAGAERLAVIGLGGQGEAQLRAVMRQRPIRSVAVFDQDVARAESFARRLSGELGVPVHAADTVADAAQTADIVVAATWAREPLLFADMVKPGAFVATFGADSPGKCEVDAGLLRRARVVVDDRDLAVSMGAVGGAGLGEEAVHATLADIAAGRRPGRERDDQVVLFGCVGLPLMDAVAAWMVYERARATGAGTPLAFQD